MNHDVFDTMAAFETEARRRGFDEVLERSWAPDSRADTHMHAFGVWAQLSRGEMWLTVDGQTRHLCPGEQFTLEPEVPHAERYGSKGAVYWAARRNHR